MKKAFSLGLLLAFFLGACATYQPPPPTLYVGSLPPSIVTELSLDERINIEDAWNSLKQGNGSKARKALSKLEEQNPFYYVGMGYAYFMLDDLALAQDFFKAAERYSPDMSIIHLGLAQIYQKTGQEDLAFAEYREALKIEPDNSWVAAQYETLKVKKTEESLNEGRTSLSAGDVESSKEAFLKALYYSPESTEAHLALADIFQTEDKLESALVHLEAASTNEPENQEILKKYGEALFLANENKKGLDVYEDLVEKEPENQDYRQRLEILKNRLGIFELPSQYNAIIASEAVSKEEMAALLVVTFKDILDEPSKKPDIIIDIATSWASDYILKTTSLGFLDIYPNHTFRPKKIITRAEMAEILLRLIEHLREKGYRFIQQIPPDKIQISDVLPDNYYYQPIIEIVSYDIMSLSLDQTFKPDVPVSGQESIKLLDIILNLIR
ncbi:MAG: S-layer homology domain-containing protein [Candidatus Aminicenantes bacterium]|nr:S-layer homology domain-containing protein [Candidatus Aminicenantes bacterium]MDH5383721.1 S-layer homology domain-containing protein [Candidatus Aminicenantes bacterium]